MERQIERSHHEEYAEYIDSKTENVDNRPSTSKRKRDSNDKTPIPPAKKNPQPTIDSIFNQTITIAMSAHELKDACIDLVTINGRPFTLMEDTGFRKIIDPILKPLNAGKQTVAINSENVRDMVRERATEIRSSIGAPAIKTLIFDVCYVIKITYRSKSGYQFNPVYYCKKFECVAL